MSDLQSPDPVAADKPKRRLFGPGTIIALVVLAAFFFGLIQLVNNLPGLQGRFAPPEPPLATGPSDTPQPAAPTPESESAPEVEAVAEAPQADATTADIAPVAGVEGVERQPEEVARPGSTTVPAKPVEPESQVAEDVETLSPPADDAVEEETASADAAQDTGAVPPASEEAAATADATTQIASEPEAAAGDTAQSADATEAAENPAQDTTETAALTPAPEADAPAEGEAVALESDDSAPMETAAAAADTENTQTAVPSDAGATQPAPQEPAPAPVVSDPPVAEVVEPTFDIIRIDATGAGLVAGRAEPGAMVQIFAGGSEALATVEASASGEFVAFIQTPSQDEGQVLSLSAQLGGRAVGSDDSVLVLPGDEVDGGAPLIVRADGDDVRVVQPSALGKVDGVTLDAISYDETGAVKLSGRAAGAGPIRIYVDGTPVGAAQASDAGTWDTVLETVKEGRYVLRVDALNADGSVSSRAESPFQRVFPTAEQRANQSQITVQPGNTLWVMARDRYGDGLLYTQIFQANSDAIRDPDLIYPGQIFDLPDEEDFRR